MSVGISDIQIYIPEPRLDLNVLVDQRVKDNPRLERHLQRACRTTGQRAIRFPSLREDAATLAASSALRLFRENPDLDPSALRFLAVGTETGVDHSKPLSSYVGGMLQKAGIRITSHLSNFQVQHACAGGTLALLGVSSLLSASANAHDAGLVICSDIARYQTHSTAEVTQGAGAVSLLVQPVAGLIELDLGSQGFCSKDVDDFFRPLGSKTAEVKGTYSMQMYRECLESAFLDHCARRGELPEDVLMETDMFALHAPFRNLPEIAMVGLLGKYLSLDEEDAQRILASRGIQDAIEPVADVGNIYNGAVFLSLASLLSGQYAKLGDRIVGKRLLLASYGSGSTMTVVSGRVADGAPQVLRRWDLDAAIGTGRAAEFSEYQQWIDSPYAPSSSPSEVVAAEAGATPPFTIANIRGDGYREYSYNERIADAKPKGRAPVDLYQSA